MTALSVGAAISVWGTHEADTAAKRAGSDAPPAMHPVGTMCITFAAVLGGIRIVVLQRALQCVYPPPPPSAVLAYLAASSFTALVLPALLLEGAGLAAYAQERGAGTLGMSLALAVLSTAMAIVLTIAEILVVLLSSAFAFTTICMIKQLVVVALARFIYKDRLTTTILAGYCTTLLGVAWYKHIRHVEKRRAASPGQPHRAAHAVPRITPPRSPHQRLADTCQRLATAPVAVR